MTIRHLVLSGGGPAGLLTYGTMKHLIQNKFIELSNIKTIHACSIGAFMAVVLLLQYEWDWLDDYFIKRPWEKLSTITARTVLDSFSEMGLLDNTIVESALEPLLTAKELTSEFTLQEFYNYTNIELVIYVANLNQPKLTKVVISHKTYPDMPLVTAISMTMAVPILFKPVFYKDNCYIDGGCLANLPIDDCIAATNCKLDEILALRYIWNSNTAIVTSDSSLFDYISILIRKSHLALSTENEQTIIPYKIVSVMPKEFMEGIHTWLEVLGDEQKRVELIEHGKTDALLFLKNISQRNIQKLL